MSGDDFLAALGAWQAARRQRYGALTFYPPAPAWCLPDLPVTRLGAFPAEVAFPTTDNRVKWWGAFGTVTPALPEGLGPVTLTLYTPLGEERPAQAFLPFRDGTAAAKTYPLGRYLDVPLTWPPEASGEPPTALLDFNRAYQPACAYEDGMSCPVPPPQHQLAGRVRAGERLAEDLSHFQE